ncbi:MAG: 23S rRNA (pseudouridine(1915)-N(3))-methyltransferase RlmH [Muribaculaceae bacterium]|nr:23S rRNA (pseudouridine(1915)-N(3))-methyltransferase RlmH [Muribaculaceae bacterium]MDE7141433.1 23S rRNA (pseudouridine(1915)-N(3))-methyltransferase RlmH [Muribaculaceae bacterium]
MKITLLVIGKTNTASIAAGIDDYASRVNRYIPFEIITLPDARASRSMTETKQKEAEGKLILGALRPGDRLVLLDERGAELTSRQFSEMLERRVQTVAKRLVFAVGGPYGFSEEVYARADEKLSLSKMTFPHELVRLFFVEQLYRAQTISRGEPYHHD